MTAAQVFAVGFLYVPKHVSFHIAYEFVIMMIVVRKQTPPIKYVVRNWFWFRFCLKARERKKMLMTWEVRSVFLKLNLIISFLRFFLVTVTSDDDETCCSLSSMATWLQTKIGSACSKKNLYKRLPICNWLPK